MIRYAYNWSGTHRPGETAFLCSNQKNWSSSLKSVRRQAEAEVEEHMESVEPPYTRKEALEELGELTIYKMEIVK